MASVTVRPAGVTLPLRPGETILAGLYRAGYAYRIGCRRGGCGLCAAEVTSGEVAHQAGVAAEALPAPPPGADPACRPCLTCRAVPVTDVVIRLPDDSRFRCVAPLLADLAGAGPATTPTPTGSAATPAATPRTEEEGGL